jgi:chemotaxis protein MotB
MRFKVLVFAVAALALIVFAGCGVAKDEYMAKVNALKALEDKSARDADEAKKKIADLDKSLADCGKEKDTLNNRIGSLENNLTDKQQQLNQCNLAAKEKIKKLEEKTENYENLTKSLQGEISKGQIELTNLKGKLTVKMKDKVVFASGSTKVAPEGKDALKKIADALKDMPDKAVLVQGHTDNVPPGPKSPYADNWELSLARALAVTKLLIEFGIDPTRLEAAGLGQFQPIASNDNEDGRSQNRRIELGLVAIDQITPAPVQGAKPTEKPDAKPDAKKGKK